MLGEALIEEGVIALDKVEDASVVAQDRGKKQLALTLHCCAQRCIKLGELLHIGALEFEVAQVQPLAGKILLQRQCAVIGEHARYLLLEHLRLAQLALFRQQQQLFIGQAAPQKQRQARCVFSIAN